MANQDQSIDEFIMSLVGMGFELEDAQQAVQIGKLQINDAIEWIVAGKPAVANLTRPADASGRLQLGIPSNSLGANPFSNPEESKPRDSSDIEMKEKDVEDDPLTSRYHMKDEQRVIKERFEEKQRDGARRHAIEEKKAAKKAKDQILKQIQEDREMAKLRKAPLATAPVQKTGESIEEKKSVAVSPAKQDLAVLQIRLPDGRALKQTFTPDTPLQEVWTFVQKKFSGWQNHCLMQPFPRQEYGEADLEKLLSELGLVPTGSLVLKKLEISPPTQPMDVATERSQEGAAGIDLPQNTLPLVRPPDAPTNPPAVQLPEMENPIEPPMMPPVMPPVMPPAPPLPGAGPGHHWGTGHRMDGEQEEEQEAQEGEEGPEGGAVGGPEDMEAESGEDDADPPQPLPPLPGGLEGMGWAQDNQWHPWGEGQAMEQVIDPENNLPHHRKNPKELAAEAASKRFAQAPKTEDETARSASVVMPSIPSLTVLVIQNVCGRICDTRHPITGMQGVPADVASLVLQHLIREGLLRPKTLQPFISCHLQRLVLDSYPYTTNELLAAIRYHRYLLHVSLASCPLITDKGLTSLAGLNRLKFLNIGSNIKMNDGCFSVINQLPNLVTLGLEGTGITDSGVISLAKSAPQHLQNLDLSRTEITQQILPSLQAIPNLKTLNLEGTQVVGLSGVQNLEKLEILNVCNTPIVTDSLMCLANLNRLVGLNISKTPNVHGNQALGYIAGLKLQYLQLPNRLSTDDIGMKHIANMPLQLLDLTNFINVGDPGMEPIGQITSLKKLRLSNTKITDEGLFYLAGLKNLDELELDRTAVSDTGADVITNFSLLQELSLSETRITNDFLKSGTLNSCVMLSKLNLSKTKISDKGIQHLKLPHLSLLNLDGTGVSEDKVQSLPACPQLQKIIAKNLINLENEEDS